MRKTEEANLQKAVAKYLDLLGVLWFHCPNGGTRNIREAANLKAQGVKRGISDVIILEPRGCYHGLMIELKSAKGRLSESQKIFLKKCDANGYAVSVCYSFDSAKGVIDTYMSFKE